MNILGDTRKSLQRPNAKALYRQSTLGCILVAGTLDLTGTCMYAIVCRARLHDREKWTKLIRYQKEGFESYQWRRVLLQ